MDALNRIVAIPSWAYDFCWYYAAVAAIVAVYSVWGIVQLFMLPGVVKRFVPTLGLSIGMALSSIVTIVLVMMQFWICRASLAPTRSTEKFAAKSGSHAMEGFAAHMKSGSYPRPMGTEGFAAHMKSGSHAMNEGFAARSSGSAAYPRSIGEGFATACKSGADCTAVAGLPQGSDCSCGGRGFCGGCVMQNNMEPSMGYDGFAPL